MHVGAVPSPAVESITAPGPYDTWCPDTNRFLVKNM